ncbi:cytochrome P450 [Polaromonas sp.]|uniref:cytochrome P450 n=1 Tax=Polaromonas sp. TaxID=1869339 RepID=UPI002FC5CD58
MHDPVLAQPVNPIAAVTHDSPYPYYRQLREQRPLYFDEGLKLWVASSHAVVDEAFRCVALRVRPPAEPVPQALLGTAAGEVFAQLVRMTDGEFHAAHKPAVAQGARRWTLAQLALASRDTAAELFPALDANTFLTALPVQAMARLLGVSASLLGQTSQWVHEFTQGIAPGAAADRVARASVAAQGLMAQGLEQGLSSVQAANRIAMMQQSLDATAGLLGNTVCQLQREPALAQRTAQSLDFTRELVAEVARWDAPVQNTRRFAADQLVLAGQSIEQGQGVLLVLASANRDPALNVQPDLFDPQRQQRRSMTFGAAAHACPGELIAIEIVAACAHWMGGEGLFDTYFGRQAGFAPLSNARIPVFAVH